MAASEQNIPQEVVSLRTMCSKTVQNEDGSFTLQAGIHGKPIHYKEGGLGSNERWQDIDLSNLDDLKTLYKLTRSAEGVGYTVSARELDYEEVTVTMLDVDVSGVEPVRSVEDGVERITWPNALTDCDIFMMPKPWRFGVFKVLKSENAPRTFRFQLDGLVPSKLITPESQEITRAALISKMIDGESVDLHEAYYLNLMLPPALAWDATGELVEVRRTLEGDMLTEEVIIPDGFDAWPVLVDTDVSYYSSTDDAQLRKTGSIYQVSTSGNTAYCGYSSYTYEYRFIIPFDTSGLPDSATITAAAIYLYLQSKSGSSTLTLYEYTGSLPVTADSTCWGACGATSFASKTLADLTASAYNSFSLNSSGYGIISATGITQYMLRGSTLSANNYGIFRTADYTGTDYDPYISITYTDNNKALAGTTDASASVTGSITVTKPLSGEVSAQGAASGKLTARLAGAINAVSGTAAVLRFCKPLVGTVAAVCSTAGSLTVTKPLSGAVNASSNAAGVLTKKVSLIGNINATSTATGTATRTISLVGAINSVCGTTGALTRMISGSVNAQGGASAVLTRKVYLSAAVAASSTVSGVMLRLISGTISGQSGTTGVATVSKPLAGIVNAQATTTAALSKKVGLAGQIAAASGLTGTILKIVNMSGSVDAQAEVAAALTKAVGLSGQITSISGTAASLTKHVPLTGLVVAQSEANGQITKRVALQALVSCEGSLSGQISVYKALAGQVRGSTAIAAAISLEKLLTGSIAGQSDIQGRLTQKADNELIGVIAGVSSVSGRLLTLAPDVFLFGSFIPGIELQGILTSQINIDSPFNKTVLLGGLFIPRVNLIGEYELKIDLRGCL